MKTVKWNYQGRGQRDIMSKVKFSSVLGIYKQCFTSPLEKATTCVTYIKMTEAGTSVWYILAFVLVTKDFPMLAF